MSRPPITLQSIAGPREIPEGYDKPVYVAPLYGYDDMEKMSVEHLRLVHEYTYEIYAYAKAILRWRKQAVTVDNLTPLVMKYHHDGFETAVRASYANRAEARDAVEWAAASG